MGYGLLLIGFLICAIASWNVNATFKRYQKISNRRGMTAAEAARQILNENGLQFIQIERVSGSLTDHYDPRANVIRLSDSVYDSTSVAAIGVAAHECGHAVQHAVGYTPIKIRQAIIPVTQFGSYAWYFVLVLGLILSSRPLVYGGILLFSLIVLFQFVTLPVEIYSYTKKPLHPKIYALFTLLFLLILVLMVTMNLIQLRGDKKRAAAHSGV